MNFPVATQTLQRPLGQLQFWERILSTLTPAQTTFDLTNQVVAITGASSGFGYHFAGVLAAQGARVVLGARRLEKLEDCVTEIKQNGGEAVAVALDVRERQHCGFLDAAYEHYGRCDVVTNGVGLKQVQRPITLSTKMTGTLFSTLT